MNNRPFARSLLSLDLKYLLWILAFLIFHQVNGFQNNQESASQLKLAIFDVDATPPIGSPLAYDSTANRWDLGLRAKGIVLLGAGQPIVIVSVDWIGIANDSQDAFKQALAKAAGTVSER